jgi:DNA-binding MarR family transcriptional regulator
VTYPQYLVLVVLWQGDAMSVGELAAALLMDLGSISPMLKRMEKKGLVVRGRDPNDERRVVVSLSARGHALRARTKQMLGEFYCYLSVPGRRTGGPEGPPSSLHDTCRSIDVDPNPRGGVARFECRCRCA